jgi:hypothetical protein
MGQTLGEILRGCLLDLGLGASEVVLGQIADALEEAGSLSVVEEMAWEPLGARGQTLAYGVGEARLSK